VNARTLVLAFALVIGCRGSLPQDALLKAIARNDVAESKRMVEEHPDWVRAKGTYGDSPLMVASRVGNLELATYLVDRGAHVNYQEGRDGWTSLMLAAEFGHVPVIEYLISKGAYIELARKDGDRAITRAAMQGHVGAVRALLKAGAHVEFPDGGKPAINAAIEKANYDIVVAIVEAGADLKSAKPKNMGGGTWPKPLELARGRKLAAIEAYLVGKGAE
jgi:hypothetical protein